VSRADVASTREELENEREFLLRSLRDLDAERDAGDIDAEDYAVLYDRYTARAADVLRSLVQAEAAAVAADAVAAIVPPPGAKPRRARRRRLLVVGGVVAFVAVAVVVVLDATGVRLPGATATGSPTLGKAQEIQRQLAQAVSLEGSGRAVDALHLYRQVLSEDPTQAQALAESGWLEFEAGVQAKDAAVVTDAQRQEQAAVRADPGAYAPHLYLGSMLLVEGDAQGAVSEFRTYLADNPPAASVQRAAPFITRAFTQAGLVPPSLPAS
jgi:tetratricopeptide (TPR) repeat protein